MNLHPIFVHFPIALFSLYTFIEILRFKKISDRQETFYIKAVLSIAGVFGAFAALLFGDTAAHEVMQGIITAKVDNPVEVIELHEFLAQLGTFIFILPAAGYAVAWLNKFDFINKLPGKFLKSIWQFGTLISKWIIETPLVILLSLVGIVIITIAAALGGSIIYGPDSDPIVKIIFNLFF